MLKKNIIIFGAGEYGASAYCSLHDGYSILCYVDNNAKKQGSFLFGVPVISIEELSNYYNNSTDIIVCMRDYYSAITQLSEIGIDENYVMLEGFLYHNTVAEAMIPVELGSYKAFKREDNNKNILFIQNMACIRTHKIASVMRESGYNVFLLYTLRPPIEEYDSYREIYNDIWHFTSVNGMIDFINQSDFDVLHCSNEPDILVNVALQTSKPVVFDTHDMQSVRTDVDIETIALEFIANTKAEGNIYTSKAVKEIAEEKFDLSGHEVIAFENMMEKQYDITFHPKLSKVDDEIHCVYEGGIVGNIRDNHRFFENIWLEIASQGIHIHFYSQSDEEYCRLLDSKSEYLHYEGNIGGKDLIEELTQYDCGLAIFNVTKRNRTFLETGTANKMYEYLNAGLPVVVGDIQSYVDFVNKYKVGIKLDMGGDILKQLCDAIKIKVEKDFLDKHGFTMEAKQKDLINFYERVMKKSRKVAKN